MECDRRHGAGAHGGMHRSSSQKEQKASSPHIDPAHFTTKIDNEYFPMKPGTTFLYEGGTEHSEMTVTNQTKNVMGVGVRRGRSQGMGR